jgi:small-conductance mechanosensitive channel
MSRALTIVLSAALAGIPASAASETPRPIRTADIVTHLEQTIAWYRYLAGIADSTTGDVLERDTLRRQALNAVHLGFDFARAEAVLLARQAPANSSQPTTQSQNLQQAATRAEDRVNALQGQVHDLETALQKAPLRSRAALAAQRDEVQAELGLAKQVQSTVQNLLKFAGSQEAGRGPAGELTAEINQLETSVPQTTPQQAAPAATIASNKASTPAQVFRPESAGILSLFGELFTLTHTRSQLSDGIRRTDGLIKDIDRLRAPLVNQLRQQIRQGEALAAAAPSSDPRQLAANQHQIEDLSASFKQISTATTPLGEQTIVVGTTRATLSQMREGLTEDYSATGRYLLLRLGILAIAILVVLAISEFWRRASLKYIHDPRRRRPFLVLRRVVVGTAIGVTVVLSFVSEFGSLATYAGLLTAGLAVALQNVILSVVAYFFLIGRYGVRIGDRVTISGVTGTVVDIGLVRLYLMELLGSGAEMHATGRVVVFSNSVLFQPSASFFKQMPGTDYVWHTVKLSLTLESDFQVAQTRLSAAVDSVYQEYRESIEKQHAAFERSVEIQLTTPKPECRLRFTEGALEVVVQYPVPFQNASRIDEQVMRALYDTISQEPKLTLASSGAPQMVTA